MAAVAGMQQPWVNWGASNYRKPSSNASAKITLTPYAKVSVRRSNENDRVFRLGHSRLTTTKLLARTYPAFLSGRPRRFLLLDRALQFQRAGRQLGRFRLQQKRIEAAAVIDALGSAGAASTKKPRTMPGLLTVGDSDQ
jgi:hypothetical protein